MINAQSHNQKTPFLVEGSSLAKEMWCNEDYKTGDIECNLEYEADEATDPVTQFNIEELTDDYQRITGYYDDIWDENKIYKFEPEDPNALDDIGPLTGMIELAINDYDKMIFSS